LLQAASRTQAARTARRRGDIGRLLGRGNCGRAWHKASPIAPLGPAKRWTIHADGNISGRRASETRARLLEKGQLRGRALAAENRVAMGEAAEAADHLAMALGK